MTAVKAWRRRRQGLVSYGAAKLLPLLRVDDALEVSAVHGVAGAFGSVALGFCASAAANPAVADGLLYNGGAGLLASQLFGVAVVAGYSAAASALILVGCHYLGGVGGIRLSEHDEVLGLDAVEHDEIAYILPLVHQGSGGGGGGIWGQSPPASPFAARSVTHRRPQPDVPVVGSSSGSAAEAVRRSGTTRPLLPGLLKPTEEQRLRDSGASQMQFADRG